MALKPVSNESDEFERNLHDEHRIITVAELVDDPLGLAEDPRDHELSKHLRAAIDEDEGDFHFDLLGRLDHQIR